MNLKYTSFDIYNKPPIRLVTHIFFAIPTSVSFIHLHPSSPPNLIGVRATLISNQRWRRLRGAKRFVVLHHEEAPLSLHHLWLEINVALTPIKFVAGHQLNNLYKRSGWQAQGLSLVGLKVGASEWTCAIQHDLSTASVCCVMVATWGRLHAARPPKSSV